jgi:plasmid replication initiation protein
MAMRVARPVQNNALEGRFPVTEFFQILNLQDSGKKRNIIKDALKGVAASVISYHDEGIQYAYFPWISSAIWEVQNDEIVITFNATLTPYIIDLKKNYTRLSLEYIGRFRSKYAIRFYKLALSKSGFAGKQGNKPNEWLFYMSIEDIKTIFKIGDDEYKGRTDNFKRYVITQPIDEINKANVGIHIEPVYKKHKRTLTRVIFLCRWEKQPPIPSIATTQVSPLENRNQLVAIRTAEDRQILDAFPEEAAAISKEVEVMPMFSIWKDPNIQKQACEGGVILELQRRHPDFKPTKVPATKRKSRKV